MNARSRTWLPAILCLLFLVPASEGFSEIRSGRIEIATENVEVEVGFGERDARRIREYYERRHREYRYDDDDDHDDDRRGRKGKYRKGKKVPPGLAKKDELPPGLQKQIRKHGKLPPGLSGRLLPRELERTLHPLPGRYVRVQVEGDVIILDRETSIVVDVIHDVHRLLSRGR